ncbi:MAG: hypothetical protein U1E66_04565 [Rhodospirillales bacterium]
MGAAEEGQRLRQVMRELDLALAAATEPGAGAIGNLECRIADLQQRFLATPAVSLADVETRLGLIRHLVAGLGPPGYLLHLVDATLADVRRLATEPAS